MIRESDRAHFDVDCQIASHREEIEHLCREFEINSACDTPSVLRLERGRGVVCGREGRRGAGKKKREGKRLHLAFRAKEVAAGVGISMQ